MNIFVNGETRQVADAITLTSLLDELELTSKRVAVEVNQELVPRSEHVTHVLQAEDRVEIVQAIGGG